jgi:hypothetical protein
MVHHLVHAKFGLLKPDYDIWKVGWENIALVQMATDRVDGGDHLADIEWG